jgi:hypothetical protein
MNHDTNKVVALLLILGGIMAGACVANSPPDLPYLWLLKAAATALPAMSAAFLRFETSAATPQEEFKAGESVPDRLLLMGTPGVHTADTKDMPKVGSPVT